MVDLRERLHDTAAAFTGDLSLENPSLSGGVPLAAPVAGRSPRRRRSVCALSIAALVSAVAALGAVLFSGGDSQMVAPVAVEPVVTTTTFPHQGMTPQQRIEAAVDLTFASQSFVITTGLWTADGQKVEVPGSSSGAVTTFQSPGLLSTSVKKRDGSWITNGYYDLVLQQDYWLVDTGTWRSAPIRPSDQPLGQYAKEAIAGGPETCVVPVDEYRLLVVGRPTGPCPSVAPPEAEWPALGSSKQLVTLRSDGRLERLFTPLDELPFPIPGAESASMGTAFDEYDVAEPVVLPDPATVIAVSLPEGSSGSGMNMVTGFQQRS